MVRRQHTDDTEEEVGIFNILFMVISMTFQGPPGLKGGAGPQGSPGGIVSYHETKTAVHQDSSMTFLMSNATSFNRGRRGRGVLQGQPGPSVSLAGPERLEEVDQWEKRGSL